MLRKIPGSLFFAGYCSSHDNKPKGNWCCFSLRMGNVDISAICLTVDSWHSLWEIILGGKETSQTPPLPLLLALLGSCWVLWIIPPGMSLPHSCSHPFLPEPGIKGCSVIRSSVAIKGFSFPGISGVRLHLCPDKVDQEDSGPYQSSQSGAELFLPSGGYLLCLL